MPVPSPVDPYLPLRREFAVRVDADGHVTTADDAATSRFGLTAGDSLRAIAAEGSGEKLQHLLDTVIGAPVSRWELHLTSTTGPVTAVLNGAPDGAGGAYLVGSLVADDVATTAAALGETMQELIALQRETAQQRRQLEAQHAALVQSTHALEESHAGVAALYAELEASHARLREAAEARTRFFANANHELKTPLNSILALSEILLTGADGALSAEQRKQLGFIRQSAETLNLLVQDVLDVSKTEAGKVILHTAPFSVSAMLGALRGMLRPLAVRPEVALVVEEPAEALAMDTDEGRVAQILRNLVSNALKFTERGEVRVRTIAGEGGTVTFEVRDTGIGIGEADQARVFEEFEQIRGPLQVKARGSGLGLSLSRQLATLLGGTISLESALGRGSVFRLTLPRTHPESAALAELATRAARPDPAMLPVLIVEDDAQTLLLYEHQLRHSGYQVIPARSLAAARAVLARVKPSAIVLDVMLEGETSWSFLQEMKEDPRTCDIPILVVTVMTRENRARALGADEFAVKPVQREWLMRRLGLLTVAAGTAIKLLVIDDDESYRYVVRRMLRDDAIEVLEAPDGPEGIAAALEHQPDIILLDVVMPKMTAFEVLDDLKGHPRTRPIPVIVNTSKTLTPEETRRLQQGAVEIFSKETLSREVALSRIREALAKATRPEPARGG